MCIGRHCGTPERIWWTFAFSASTLLVGRQEEHSASACKKAEWWGAGMVSYLERGAGDLHMAQLMPLPTPPPIITCFIKIHIALPFCCWLTQVVLEKRPLNGTCERTTHHSLYYSINWENSDWLTASIEVGLLMKLLSTVLGIFPDYVVLCQWGWLEVTHRRKADWRSTITAYGARSAAIILLTWTHKLLVTPLASGKWCDRRKVYVRVKCNTSFSQCLLSLVLCDCSWMPPHLT